MLKKAIKKIITKTLPYDFTNPSENIQNLVKLLKKFKINKVLDIGANTGQYAESLFNNGYDGKIVSFEPLTVAYNILSQKKNKYRHWEIAERCALGEQDKEIFINISKNLFSSSILPMLKTHSDFAPESRYISTEKVQMFKLDTICPKYIQQDDVTFLKMDVQGYEKYVLMGSEKILKQIKGIQLECSLLPLYEGEMLFIDQIKNIENKGYTLYDIIPGFRDSASGRLLQVDCIFFKNESIIHVLGP